MIRRGDILALGAVGLLVAAGSTSARASGSRARPRFGEPLTRANRDQQRAWMRSVYAGHPELFNWEIWVVLNGPGFSDSIEPPGGFGNLRKARQAAFDKLVSLGADAWEIEEAEPDAKWHFEIYWTPALRRLAVARSISGRRSEIDPWEGITPEEEELWSEVLGDMTVSNEGDDDAAW